MIAGAGLSPFAQGGIRAGAEAAAVSRRPSADGAGSPIRTQRAAGAAAFVSSQAAELPATKPFTPVTPGGPSPCPSSWSLSVLREGGGEGGVEMVQVQLMMGDNLIGTPKGQQEEQGVVVRLRR